MTGLVDNATLRTAVAAFAAKPEQSSYLEVLRNCFQGDLLLDVTGHAPDVAERASGPVFPAGSTIGFRETEGPDGTRGLLAFTRQEEAARMHDDPAAQVQTIGQPAVAVLEFAREHDYGWLYIDPAGPTCGLSLSDLEFALDAPHNDAVKAAIGSGDRGAVIDALAAGGQLLYSVKPAPGEGAQVRTSVGPDGQSVFLAFTSAAEVVARGSGDAFAPIDIARVLVDSLAEPFAGLVINPSGPWVALGRDELLEAQRRLAS